MVVCYDLLMLILYDSIVFVSYGETQAHIHRYRIHSRTLILLHFSLSPLVPACTKFQNSTELILSSTDRIRVCCLNRFGNEKLSYAHRVQCSVHASRSGMQRT